MTALVAGFSALGSLAACGVPESAMDSPSGVSLTVDPAETEMSLESRLVQAGRLHTLTVCATGCDYAEIQPAVEAAQSGDVVRVSRGTYSGPISVVQKSIVIRGDGPRQTTISMGNPVIGFQCSPSVEVRIAGVTITNGGGRAGGVVNDGCALTLRDVAVTQNAVHASGAGIQNSGTLLLSNCRLTDNLARVAGGGLYNTALGTAEIRDTTISDNTAGITGGGGVLNEGNLVVRDSVFARNNGKHGGAFLNGGVLTIRDSTLVENHAYLTGGAVYNEGTLWLRGSHVARNVADIDGGGVQNEQGALVFFRDTSVRANVPDNCAGATCP
ncbi:MAG: right-handed parallel beta-helix repeat-containing protein [Deltaproteobacteria bacterium]